MIATSTILGRPLGLSLYPFRRFTRGLLPLLLALPGCHLFQPEYARVDPADPVVATLLAKYAGDLDLLRAVPEDLAELKGAISARHGGAEVLDVDEFGGEILAKLEPVVRQALDEGGEKFLAAVKANPTWGGLLEGALAFALGAGGVVAVRSRKPKPTATSPPAPDPGGASTREPVA